MYEFELYKYRRLCFAACQMLSYVYFSIVFGSYICIYVHIYDIYVFTYICLPNVKLCLFLNSIWCIYVYTNICMHLVYISTAGLVSRDAFDLNVCGCACGCACVAVYCSVLQRSAMCCCVKPIVDVWMGG